MGNEVYANMMEVSCKAAMGKAICAFPDVCFTPPTTPATPPGVPIPYPNTGMASDTTSGSTSVKISGQEVMLKNKSYFKQSYGDEAGCAPKKGVVTSVNRGKVYFTMWSMDVKVEGENVVRNFDLTTHNHNPPPGNSPPWMYVDSMAPPPLDHPCHDEIVAAQDECKNTKMVPNASGKSQVRDCKGTDCARCMACIMVPKSKDKKLCCHPENTGHHFIQDNWIKENPEFPSYISLRVAGNKAPTAAERAAGKMTDEDAPTVCANRFRSVGTKHRTMHDIQGAHCELHMPGQAMANEPWDYAAAKRSVHAAHQEVFPKSNCSKNCLDSQMDAFYGSDGSRKLNPPAKDALGEEREALLKKYAPSKPKNPRKKS